MNSSKLAESHKERRVKSGIISFSFFFYGSNLIPETDTHIYTHGEVSINLKSGLS